MGSVRSQPRFRSRCDKGRHRGNRIDRQISDCWLGCLRVRRIFGLRQDHHSKATRTRLSASWATSGLWLRPWFYQDTQAVHLHRLIAEDPIGIGDSARRVVLFMDDPLTFGTITAQDVVSVPTGQRFRWCLSRAQEQVTGKHATLKISLGGFKSWPTSKLASV